MSEDGKPPQKSSHPHSKGSPLKGGVDGVADMMNELDPEHRERLLANVAQRDPSLAQKIRDQMFVFEDLSRLNDPSIQTLLREIPSELWAIALRNAPSEFQEVILRNLTKRARAVMEEDIQGTGPQLLSKVQEAQRKIVALAKKLEGAGKLSLSPQSGENS